MKSVLLRWLMIVTALASVIAALSVTWARPLDAPPEAIISGAALLVLASALRYRRVQSRAK